MDVTVLRDLDLITIVMAKPVPLCEIFDVLRLMMDRNRLLCFVKFVTLHKIVVAACNLAHVISASSHFAISGLSQDIKFDRIDSFIITFQRITEVRGAVPMLRLGGFQNHMGEGRGQE